MDAYVPCLRRRLQRYYLPSSTVDPGTNLYEISEAKFNEDVNGYILNAAAAHENEPTPDVPWTEQILKVFAASLGYTYDPDPVKIAQLYTNIDKYLWANVLRMRELNPYVPGATSRTIMPRTDPLPKTQTYFAGGALSYTFPTISYLG